jgi:hypothetical protein
VIPNVERTTIALSFYSAFTADNAPAGRHAAMLLIHTSAPQDWKGYCHTDWATDAPLAASICFTFAARARELNRALCCNELHSLHTGRPPCWEFVLAPFAHRARKLGCALVCNEFWLGLNNRSQFLELVFGSFASHSAAQVVVMTSSSGYQKWFPMWSHSVAHWVVISSCFWYRKWFPVWGHVLVLLAHN